MARKDHGYSCRHDVRLRKSYLAYCYNNGKYDEGRAKTVGGGGRSGGEERGRRKEGGNDEEIKEERNKDQKAERLGIGVV